MNEKQDTDQVFVAVINADRTEVWRALTRPEFTARYWHSTRVQSDFRVGSVIEFLVDEDEVGCCGEILEVRELELLSYTWTFPRNPLVRDESPSRVTFRLETIGDEATGTATRLTVVHDRFPAGSRMVDMVSPGWPLVLAGLKTLLETGSAVDYSSMTAA